MTSHVDSPLPSNVEEKKPEKPSRICKKTVKSRYALTDKDIEKLDCDEVPNPYYRSRMSMYLFDEDTVREFAHMKYGGEIGLEKKLEKRAASCEKRRQSMEKKFEKEAAISEKRRQSMEKKQDNRKDELQRRLQDRNLTLRCDSKLCASYIDRGTPSLDFVVEMMHEMNFYFTKTNYSECYEEVAEVHKKYEYYYDAEEVSSSAKGEALSKWLKQFENEDDALQKEQETLPPNIVKELKGRIEYALRFPRATEKLTKK